MNYRAYRVSVAIARVVIPALVACRLHVGGCPLYTLSLGALFQALIRTACHYLKKYTLNMSADTLKSSVASILKLTERRGYEEHEDVLVFLCHCVERLKLGPNIVKQWRLECFPTCAFERSDGRVVAWVDNIDVVSWDGNTGGMVWLSIIEGLATS